ncbi:hypothetical protein GPEL0_01f0059 [Geoanaerobacter pelophilus]|uniref:Uncharacterized protein n=1 Tax=Geoanaerobacter pelophilus TaxID=60036 RepID=A0ABQ0MGJ8_9BACT|nr:hypothetical protein GPEL0_01f0059 [Geoanaerobacter pelophilus]
MHCSEKAARSNGAGAGYLCGDRGRSFRTSYGKFRGSGH